MDWDIDDLLARADGFHGDNDEALEFIEDRIRELANLDEELDLVRVVFIAKGSPLDTDNLGNCWTDDETIIDQHFLDYLKNECNGETIPGKPFLLRASFDKAYVNIELTMAQNLLNPQEQEIHIFDKAKPNEITIEPYNQHNHSISVEKFNQNRSASSEMSYA